MVFAFNVFGLESEHSNYDTGWMASKYAKDLKWDKDKNQEVKDKVKKSVEKEIAKYEAKLLELQKYLYSIDAYTHTK